MKMPLTLLCVGLLAGCASTPQSRIEKASEFFANLPSEQQALVRSGEVGLGFDEATARLALGDPDRTIEQETSEGRSQLWLYYQTIQNPAPGFCPAYYGGLHHRHTYFSSCYITQASLVERLRVVFRAGHVAAIERSTILQVMP